MSSVPKLLRGLSGRRRRERIEQMQSETRRKQISNENKTAAAIQSARRGVIPLPAVPTYERVTAEEKLGDNTLQRQTALDNLKSVFSNVNDRAAVVNGIPQSLYPGTTITELAVFNRYWNGFYDSIKSKLGNITPAFLLKLWDEYKGVASYVESKKSTINLGDPYSAVVFRKNMQDKAALYKEYADVALATSAAQRDRIKLAIDNAVADENVSKLESIPNEISFIASKLAAISSGIPVPPPAGLIAPAFDPDDIKELTTSAITDIVGYVWPSSSNVVTSSGNISPVNLGKQSLSDPVRAEKTLDVIKYVLDRGVPITSAITIFAPIYATLYGAVYGNRAGLSVTPLQLDALRNYTFSSNDPATIRGEVEVLLEPPPVAPAAPPLKPYRAPSFVVGPAPPGPTPARAYAAVASAIPSGPARALPVVPFGGPPVPSRSSSSSGGKKKKKGKS